MLFALEAFIDTAIEQKAINGYETDSYTEALTIHFRYEIQGNLSIAMYCEDHEEQAQRHRIYQKVRNNIGG